MSYNVESEIAPSSTAIIIAAQKKNQLHPCKTKTTNPETSKPPRTRHTCEKGIA